jgi:hypothetical protein
VAYVPARSLQAGDRGKYLGDPTLAAAILDRLAMDHRTAVRGSILTGAYGCCTVTPEQPICCPR